MRLDLTNGITETPQYKAWKFPGGEIHFKFKEAGSKGLFFAEQVFINCRINSSDDFLFLAIVIDTIKKDYDLKVTVFIPYMLYQQADRDFSVGECFSLQTICKLLRTLPVDKWEMYDPHSDVSPALLKANVIDNSVYIKEVLTDLNGNQTKDVLTDSLCVLSPDAGAYKKIFKLTEKVKFKGQVETANKYRDSSNGEIKIRLSVDDFGGKDILIIDDICVGGRTFVELADILHDKNIGHLYLAVSHGIFSNGYDELRSRFNRIYTTNSRKSEYDDPLIKMIDILTYVY